MQKLFLTIALTIASLGTAAITPNKAKADPPAVLYGTYSYRSPYYSYSYVAPAPGYYSTVPATSYFYASPYYGNYRLERGTWYEPGSDTPAYYKSSPAPAAVPAAPAPSYYNPSYYYGAYSQPRYYWGTSPTGFYYSSYYVPYY
jgi:hypothetical protein